MADGAPGVHLHDERGVRVLTLRNPPGNALDHRLLDELEPLAALLAAEPPAALVVRGAGRAFCTGVDPSVFAVLDAEGCQLVDPATLRSIVRRFRALADALADAPWPSVAAVEGPAYGGGFELALCCDLIVAGATASFALPEVRLGLLPTGGGTQRLPRRARASWAKDLVLSGRRCRADEAEREGVVCQVVDRGAALSAALELARAAADAPSGVRTAGR